MLTVAAVTNTPHISEGRMTPVLLSHFCPPIRLSHA